MNIQRAVLDRRGNITGNENIKKVSEAVKYDSVFMSKDEIEDATFIGKVDAILATKGLAVVIAKAKLTKNGNYRTFVGEKDYQLPTTELA